MVLDWIPDNFKNIFIVACEGILNGISERAQLKADYSTLKEKASSQSLLPTYKHKILSFLLCY